MFYVLYLLNVRHFIYEHRSSYLCLPEIHTMSQLFDISSVIIVLHVCAFQRYVRSPYVRQFIHDHHSSCMCLPEIHTMSLLLDISSLLIILRGCGFHGSLCLCVPELNIAIRNLRNPTITSYKKLWFHWYTKDIKL